MAESASAVRMSWPPPSRVEPSSESICVFDNRIDLWRAVDLDDFCGDAGDAGDAGRSCGC